MFSSQFILLLGLFGIVSRALPQAATSTDTPNGGVLSIPLGATAPDQSMLATRDDCQALMDGQLPSQNSIPTNFKFSGNVRTYYVSAELTEWNYAPSGW